MKRQGNSPAANSHHLYGLALDVHGRARSWIQRNGRAYGWAPEYNNKWHFFYKSKHTGPNVHKARRSERPEAKRNERPTGERGRRQKTSKKGSNKKDTNKKGNKGTNKKDTNKKGNKVTNKKDANKKGNKGTNKKGSKDTNKKGSKKKDTNKKTPTRTHQQEGPTGNHQQERHQQEVPASKVGEGAALTAKPEAGLTPKRTWSSMTQGLAVWFSALRGVSAKA